MIATLAAFVGLTTGRQDWPIGVDREVDEGFYMQVFAADQGWRIWRTENRNGVFCTAIKPADGLDHPEPVGVISLMTGGTPNVQISLSHDRRQFLYDWGATHYQGVTGKYRVPGARFWEDQLSGRLDLEPGAEQTIEVLVESYRYPAIRQGRAEETGTINLVGMGWAQSELRRCQMSGGPA